MLGERMAPEQVDEVCFGLRVSETSFYRGPTEYGGLKVDWAWRMKDLERENVRMKRAVAELTLDEQGCAAGRY